MVATLPELDRQIRDLRRAVPKRPRDSSEMRLSRISAHRDLHTARLDRDELRLAKLKLEHARLERAWWNPLRRGRLEELQRKINFVQARKKVSEVEIKRSDKLIAEEQARREARAAWERAWRPTLDRLAELRREREARERELGSELARLERRSKLDMTLEENARLAREQEAQRPIRRVMGL
ncbi:MAG: hypothetical protein M0Z46_08820 [Actinomycetota bacterium]|jgi:hypothetical protein|nr:hypothetical protein [Actinomycetota bacterium]